MLLCNSPVIVAVKLGKQKNITPVIELQSLGFTKFRDNLICCEALCFGEMKAVE